MGSLTYPNEEAVRQGWLRKMVDELDYPKHLIATEKQLDTLPHLMHESGVPKRRLDLIVFAQKIDPSYPISPLLMIEFKLAPLEPKFAQQVLGYNTYVKAPFVAIANAKEMLVGCFDARSGMTQFKPGLLSYPTLLMQIQAVQNEPQHSQHNLGQPQRNT